MEISFYGKEKAVEHVPVSDELFLRLAQSEFSKIGRSKMTSIKVDGERVKLPLISLNNRVRTSFQKFFVCFIAEQVQLLLDRCGTRPVGRDVEPFLKDLQSLSNMLRVISNTDVSYLQRT